MSFIDTAVFEPEKPKLTVDTFTKLFANQTRVHRIAASDIKRETVIYNELQFDELDVIELIMSMEEEFELHLPDELGFDAFETCGQFWDLIAQLIPNDQKPTDTF